MPFISTLRCSSHSSTLSDTGTGVFRGTCAACRRGKGGCSRFELDTIALSHDVDFGPCAEDEPVCKKGESQHSWCATPSVVPSRGIVQAYTPP